MPDNMPRIRSSVIVGLGGTGAMAALHAKRALTQFYGEIPYNVKFLVFDTDNRRPMPLRVNIRGERWKIVQVDEPEFLYLRVDDPINVIEQSESIKSWWPKTMPTRAVLNGAGGFRARGRLAFHAHADPASAAITRVVEGILGGNVPHDMRQKQGLEAIVDRVEVYVVGSVAGGTGSGSFVDAGFLFRDALRGRQHRIVGFFLLPSVFEGLPATFRVNINGYAALKELDHFFKLDYLIKRPRFAFGKREVHPDRPPYDIFNLMDATQETGQTIPGKRTAAGVNTLARILGEGIALNVGNMGQQAESACDNLFDHIVSVADGGRSWGGKLPHYSSIGVSSILYPIEKHFNQISSYYAYGLIDQLMGQLKEGLQDSREKEIEDDVNNLITEARWDKDAVAEDILAYQNIVFHPSAEGYSSAEEIDQEVETIRKLTTSHKDAILKNYEEKAEETQTRLKDFLKAKDKEEGIIYTMKAVEKLSARLNVFKDESLEDIRNKENDLTSSQQSAAAFYDENIGQLGWKIWKKKRSFQDYLDQMAHVLSTDLEAERKRRALLVITNLLKTLKEYLEGMGLDAIETKLSSVRERIEKEYFSTSRMFDQYGQYSLILYPREVFTVGKDAVAIAPDKKLVFLPSDFHKLNIVNPDVSNFLKASHMEIRDLERIDEEVLKDRIASYAHQKVKSIRNTGIEDMLQLLKDDMAYWVQEASRRAIPCWSHNAAAEMASMMEEIFIVGVNDESKTKLQEANMFPGAKYAPTFMTTSDPHKIFLFKYKAPLPAYLLSDMKRSRLEYLQTSVSVSPHIEVGMEVNMEDLFPDSLADNQALHLYILCTSLGIIKENRLEKRYFVDDPRCLDPGVDSVDLGHPRWRVYEHLKEKGMDGLKKALTTVVKEQVSADPDNVKNGLQSYLAELKEACKSGDPAMALGDGILLHNQLKFLDNFFQQGADLKGLFS